jgi:hypothetical protein
MPNASIGIFVIGRESNQTLEQDKRLLEEFITDSKDSYGAQSNTRLVNSSYVTLSNGMLGYQETYYDYNNDKNLKVLYLKTFKNSVLYQIFYNAQPSNPNLINYNFLNLL